MPDLGQHAMFIWLSYGAVAAGVTALAFWVFLDERKQRMRLQELERRGLRRRSGAPNARDD